MSAVNVTHVNVLDNPSRFTNPIQFEIQYECLFNLQEDLEWKITYVGSAEDEKYDQVLDSVLVGPVVQGSYRFVFQVDPPDHTRIPAADLVGVTVILLTCAYRGKEFIRVGYYVNNDYDDEELRENPPDTVQLDRLMRNILADKPRVTKFQVEFDMPAAPQMQAGNPTVFDQTGDRSMDGSLAGELMSDGNEGYQQLDGGMHPEAGMGMGMQMQMQNGLGAPMAGPPMVDMMTE
mmetsp:Transcript_13070/g.15773  ORF Transcript_13070/g.15773 Transcript_13070/m.15773 type:complete len:234 (-) Transcript_13070:899-1600(-)|eukprot:CAMPEP_0197850212 /NCGR_PEP_ID=MMETSP1438-20131217/14645_1 /TAXON_ID=1461541 /ORGANISM="Pterosperma sp., Strain CCMP1384" /LENGTH=233 /DNA_ID=CAMNT_0043463253 /DNA_START=398 /DNA_END=1099 /DNA_ORIENTATION=+